MPKTGSESIQVANCWTSGPVCVCGLLHELLTPLNGPFNAPNPIQIHSHAESNSPNASGRQSGLAKEGKKAVNFATSASVAMESSLPDFK